MNEIEIKEISTASHEYQRLLQFRNRLLRLPLGLDLFKEDFGDDTKDFIIVAVNKLQDIIGCVMLQPLDDQVVKLRQMAIAEYLQGKGLGRVMVSNAEETARENGYRSIVLHARITAKGFYEKMGYVPFGEVFTEVTIPHIAMKKNL